MNIKKKNIWLVLIGSLLILSSFTSCESKISIGKMHPNKLDNELNTEKIWNEKVRFLCETDCKDFDNPSKLKKDYILEVCQYYKILSDSNIEYNDDIKKYIISEIEVKDIVKNLFGIDDFSYKDKNIYNPESGIYMFDDYIGFFDDEQYENEKLNRLDDQRMEFTVTVQNGATGLKHNETYILKKDEKKNNYYIATKKSQS